MKVWIKTNRSALLHPLVIASAVWIAVPVLYSMHLSRLLIYDNHEVNTVSFIIWFPFALAALCSGLVTLFQKVTGYQVKQGSEINLGLLEKRVKYGFIMWAVAAIVETVASGGLPLVWLIEGSSKTNFDYGITSIHGLVDSFFLALSVASFALFLVTRKRRHAFTSTFAFVWGVLLVSRGTILVCLLEYAIVYIRLRKITAALVGKLIAVVLLFVMAFGIIGDFRQGGSDVMLDLAQPSENYPEWLPSGVLWAYIYVTTPVNNLLNTVHTVEPINSLTFPNSASTLFPSFIRKAIYGEDQTFGNLVVSYFNVSTAYIGPYQDYGFAGMILFGLIVAASCQILWRKTSLKGTLMFSVLGQCLYLSLFYNMYLSLPVLVQLFWFYCLFLPPIQLVVPYHSLPSLVASEK